MLNAPDVLPRLVTIAKWAGIFVALLILVVGTIFKNWFFIGLGGLFLVASCISLYKFYKLGGSKSVTGMTAGEFVYGKRFKVK